MSRANQKHRSAETRQKILDTALAIGLDEGFDALSMRKIASAMQYTTTVIYHHFQSKDDVIEAVVQSQSAELGQTITAIMDQGKDALFNIRAVFHEITKLAVTEPEKFNLIVLQKYSKKKNAVNPWIGVLASQMEKAMEAGSIRRLHPQNAAFAVWSSFLGFHLMLSLQGVGMAQAEELFQTQMDIILKGIEA